MPKTQHEMKQMRKMADVLSTRRNDLANAFRAADSGGEGYVTNAEFKRIVMDACGHLRTTTCNG